MNIPLINGVQHSWASIRIFMLGRTITGIAKIEYDDNFAMEDNIGAGNMPDHRAIGDYKATLKLELFQYEITAIQTASAGKRIQQIAPFDIVVTYLPTQNAPAVVDIIKNVQFTKNVRSAGKGDTLLQVPVEVICSHIKWHGQTEE